MRASIGKVRPILRPTFTSAAQYVHTANMYLYRMLELGNTLQLYASWYDVLNWVPACLA